MRENMERNHQDQEMFWHGSGIYKHFSGMFKRPLKKGSARTTVLFVIVLFIGAFLSFRWIDLSFIGASKQKLVVNSDAIHKHYQRVEIPLNCFAGNQTQSCPARSFSAAIQTVEDDRSSSNPVCPDYFRWIHEDLRPWKERGITKEMVENAKKTANFRLVIVNGKAYLETFSKAFQTRDVFTLWGILQMLNRYPGRLPDLELMFDCVDWPVVQARDYEGHNSTAPPPLFRYCGNEYTLDIVFPDWSFWGWPEVHMKPWEYLLGELKEGNERIKWINREPYAYWKGNPDVASTRQDLMKCNLSDKLDWNARLYKQDWARESQEGYKQSDLSRQCTHRYKVYIEGSAWSVSQKYILACNSVTLLVKPHYYDFFTRHLKPIHHYWPIREDDKCRSIKFAVDWGNRHKQKAQGIGRAASEFIQEELKMDYVYDYMFHLLNEYGKLFKYKPSIPEQASELCPEVMACPAEGLEKELMMDSRVNATKDTSPCTMPPPYDPASLQALLKRKANSIRQVELWEKKYWENLNMEQ
ncbi:O-glucosyltransferase rumi homolog [Telopea speciosissima]|uniref:O-glucosyltransferase rumi homolog n=1 Tax=Telopea speciosissima TaxID=54955 RepID=UPI001CC47253|nr:O-glucosyltransferase rumi homolog [Telopea speciosissima]